MPRCPAKTHTGKRCKNPTAGRSKHCASHQTRSNRGARRRQRQALIGTLTQSRQGQRITNRRMSTQFKLKVPMRMKETDRKYAEWLYVFPKQEIYPIGDLYHARKAIDYVIGFPSTRSETGDVVRAVVNAYPEYDWKAYWNSKVKKRKAGQKKLGSFNSYLKNPSGVHQALGAHAAYGPEGLQTKQARLNPRRKMNRSKLPEVGKIYGRKGDYILVDAVYQPDRSYRSGYISYTGVGPQGVTAKTLIEKGWSGQSQWERLLSPSPNEVGMMSGGMSGADWSRAGYRKASKLPLGWKKLYAGWRKKMKGNPRRRKNAGLNVVTVKFKNSKYNYDTNVSPTSTAQSAYDYFVGQYFDMGSYPRENMQQAIGIDFNGKPVARRRKNASGAHGPLGQRPSFGPAGLVTKQGGLPAYGPWNLRKNGFVGSDAEAQELTLYISNDGDLYSRQTTSIITNLAKKMAKRTFDRAKAVKLFKYLADNGAKKYSFDFGDPQRGVRSWHSYKGFGSFTPDIRRQAAAMLLEEYMEAIQYEADLIAAKSKKNPSRRRNGKKKVFMMETRGGKYKVEVTKDPKLSKGQYAVSDYVSGRKSGGGSGFTKTQMLEKLAKTRYFGKLYDKINYSVKLDDMGFESFWGKATGERNPHCKPNPRNVKVDIELPKTNLRVVGAGKDVNGNKVIRFAMGANRGFAKQVGYSGIIHASWSDIMFDKKIKKPSAFAKAAIERIRAHGSAAQKKSLRVYKSNRR